MHAIDGAEHLHKLGAPKLMVSLVAWHTGAEYEADERGLTGRLLNFDRPPQDNLDLLIYADLTTGPAGQPMEIEQRLDEIFERYEPQHPVHRAVEQSRHYLVSCAARVASRH